MVTPEGFVERQNDELSLYELRIGTDLDGDGNPDFNKEVATEAELNLDPVTGRPLWGLDSGIPSPLICQPADLPDGRTVCSRGYAGSALPFYEHDSDRNRIVDLNDLIQLSLDYTGSKNPASLAGRQNFDADNDKDVDWNDFMSFMTRYVEPVVDCDGNGIDDPIDIMNAIEQGQDIDTNRTGVPDICDPCPSANMPSTPATAIASNRFLLVNPNNAGLPTAIRITPVSMPPGYENVIGQARYLGPLEEIGESGSSKEPVEGFGTFFASQLQCSPVYATWGTDDIKVTGAAIIPGGEYLIQNLGDGCVATIEANFSAPLTVPTVTSRGDVLSPTTGLPGDGTNIDDVLGVLKGFASAPDAPSKFRTDMEPAVVDFKINVSDALDALRGFAGIAYAAPGPVPCGQ